MDPFQALSKLPEFIARFEQVSAELIQAQQELAALKEDKYVSWDWICEYFDISKSTAHLMLAEEKFFIHGKQIKRFKKSDILRFAQRNTIKVKDIPS